MLQARLSFDAKRALAWLGRADRHPERGGHSRRCCGRCSFGWRAASSRTETSSCQCKAFFVAQWSRPVVSKTSGVGIQIKQNNRGLGGHLTGGFSGLQSILANPLSPGIHDILRNALAPIHHASGFFLAAWRCCGSGHGVGLSFRLPEYSRGRQQKGLLIAFQR